MVALTGSMSASGVYRVRTVEGEAVLKVSEGSPEHRVEARRELAFYRDLAPDLPIATPRLLAGTDRQDLTAMLLTAHSPSPPAPDWRASEWVMAARQLALLHAFPAPQGGPWHHRPWVRAVLDRPPTEVAFDFWSATAAGEHVRDLLDDPAALGLALDEGPIGFVHGDCHVDNLLRDAGDLVWADWQVAGTGCCAVDLAFLWGRAHADGADPPLEAMVDEYLTGRPVDPVRLRRSMMAAELATFLFGWPAYLGLHSPEQRERMTQRLVRVAVQWRSGTPS